MNAKMFKKALVCLTLAIPFATSSNYCMEKSSDNMNDQISKLNEDNIGTNNTEENIPVNSINENSNDMTPNSDMNDNMSHKKINVNKDSNEGDKENKENEQVNENNNNEEETKKKENENNDESEKKNQFNANSILISSEKFLNQVENEETFDNKIKEKDKNEIEKKEKMIKNDEIKESNNDELEQIQEKKEEITESYEINKKNEDQIINSVEKEEKQIGESQPQSETIEYESDYKEKESNENTIIKQKSEEKMKGQKEIITSIKKKIEENNKTTFEKEDEINEINSDYEEENNKININKDDHNSINSKTSKIFDIDKLKLTKNDTLQFNAEPIKKNKNEYKIKNINKININKISKISETSDKKKLDLNRYVSNKNNVKFWSKASKTIVELYNNELLSRIDELLTKKNDLTMYQTNLKYFQKFHELYYTTYRNFVNIHDTFENHIKEEKKEYNRKNNKQKGKHIDNFLDFDESRLDSMIRKKLDDDDVLDENNSMPLIKRAKKFLSDAMIELVQQSNLNEKLQLNGVCKYISEYQTKQNTLTLCNIYDPTIIEYYNEMQDLFDSFIEDYMNLMKSLANDKCSSGYRDILKNQQQLLLNCQKNIQPIVQKISLFVSNAAYVKLLVNNFDDLMSDFVSTILDDDAKEIDQAKSIYI